MTACSGGLLALLIQHSSPTRLVHETKVQDSLNRAEPCYLLTCNFCCNSAFACCIWGRNVFSFDSTAATFQSVSVPRQQAEVHVAKEPARHKPELFGNACMLGRFCCSVTSSWRSALNRLIIREACCESKGLAEPAGLGPLSGLRSAIQAARTQRCEHLGLQSLPRLHDDGTGL